MEKEHKNNDSAKEKPEPKQEKGKIQDNEHAAKQKKQAKQKNKNWVWPTIAFAMAIVISLAFSMLSEWALSDTTIAVAIVVIVVFIVISIVFDMLGLAVASCNVEDFHAMAARKVKGSKQALSLVKNADRVSSVCNDVIGDVCGILAGAAGAALLTKFALEAGSFMAIFVPSLISAIIAGLTIGGKAMLKKFAIDHATGITLKFAQFLNFFTRKG